ncbi:MAG: ribonuclease [Sphingomonas sp.]|nr:ribonuclease [Sphingomonas sp.]
MAEWFYEEGIGENRAILVEDGAILEAAIELPAPFNVGTVIPARLVQTLIPRRRGIAVLDGGVEALIEPLPPGLTEGATFHAEIVREAMPEPGHAKRAIVRATDDAPRPGPTLLERIGTVARPTHGGDPFEAASWSELLEEAATGEIAFTGGALRMSPTPAITLFDVDGVLPPAELAEAGAAAAGRSIRRFGIGGSIGIDLPTLPDRAARQRAAAALDAVLPQPFERTAVNGFGFLQIVRRRTRASLPEIVRADPAGATARALLRRAERAEGTGGLIVQAAPSVIAYIEARPDWIALLSRRTGVALALRAEPGRAISTGYVHRSQD